MAVQVKLKPVESTSAFSAGISTGIQGAFSLSSDWEVGGASIKFRLISLESAFVISRAG